MKVRFGFVSNSSSSSFVVVADEDAPVCGVYAKIFFTEVLDPLMFDVLFNPDESIAELVTDVAQRNGIQHPRYFVGTIPDTDNGLRDILYEYTPFKDRKILELTNKVYVIKVV